MITLAKALKLKNRLAGQYKLLQNAASQNNCRQENQKTSIDVDKVWTDMEAVRAKLVSLKGKIGVATAKIAGQLAELAEAKNDLSFYDMLHINETVQQQPVYGSNPLQYNQISFINKVNLAQRQEAKDKVQARIEELQDEIDEFNAKTKIEF